VPHEAVAVGKVIAPLLLVDAGVTLGSEPLEALGVFQLAPASVVRAYEPPDTSTAPVTPLSEVGAVVKRPIKAVGKVGMAVLPVIYASQLVAL
jgi:hypothetical protein